MMLSKEQVLAAVHGALLKSIDENGRLRAARFTAEQREDYGLDAETFPHRCRATANITLDFVTDSSWFGFEYEVLPATAIEVFSVDLFVDGVLYASQHRENLYPCGVLFELPRGKHRVTVFLPWTVEMLPKCVGIEDGACFEAVSPAGPRVLAIGDSITQGYCAAHPGLTWVSKMQRDLDAEVLNLGVGGYGFLTNSLNRATVWPADVIALAYGTNDYSRESTRQGFYRCADSYLRRLRELYPHTPVLMVLPIYRRDDNTVYRERSREYNLEDAREMLRSLAAGYNGITVLEGDYYPHEADLFAPDFLHPNDLGFQLYGERVVKAIREMGIR